MCKIFYYVNMWLKMSKRIKEFCFKGRQTGAKKVDDKRKPSDKSFSLH